MWMTYNILEEHGRETGWDEHSMLLILCEYIDNQKDPECFEDFVIEKKEEELDVLGI